VWNDLALRPQRRADAAVAAQEGPHLGRSREAAYGCGLNGRRV